MRACLAHVFRCRWENGFVGLILMLRRLALRGDAMAKSQDGIGLARLTQSASISELLTVV